MNDSAAGRAAARKPRLCFLLPAHWAAQMGGAEYQAHLILERLLALDRYDVHYLARTIDPSYRPQRYEIHPIGARAQRLAGTFFPDAPRLWKTLCRIRPDVIYQRVGCAYTGVAARYARAHGARMVWHVSSDRDVTPRSGRWALRTPLDLLDKRMLEYGVRNADAVIVQSLEQGRLLQQHYRRSHTALVPNFHPDTVGSIVKPTGRVRICWIANMKPLKRPDVFLRLANDLRHRRDVDFIIAGRMMAHRQRAAELEAQLRATPNVQYAGALPLTKVNDLLASSHLLVNTSDYEGFSNVFIQAWMREVPVISLAVDPDGVLARERHGICASGDYGTLLRAVGRLIDDDALRAAMGKRSRQFAAETFGLRNIDRLLRVLDPHTAPRDMRGKVGHEAPTGRVSR